MPCCCLSAAPVTAKPRRFFYFPIASAPKTTTNMASPPKPRLHVVFSADVSNMNEWAERTHIPLTTADAIGASWARAHRWLNSLQAQLVTQYGWEPTKFDKPETRLLYSVEKPSIWRSSIGLPAGPPLRLQLPINAASFFSPDRRIQWQMVFHSYIFESLRKICAPVNDILNLMQCLLTGMVTVVFEETLPDGVYRTVRGLPSDSWIQANERQLIEVFGVSHFKALRKACSEKTMAYKVEVHPHTRR